MFNLRDVTPSIIAARAIQALLTQMQVGVFVVYAGSEATQAAATRELQINIIMV